MYKIQITLLVFLFGFFCKGSKTNLENNQSEINGKTALKMRTSVYGFSVNKIFSEKIRDLIGVKHGLNKTGLYDICLEINEDTNTAKFGFADFSAEEFIEVPIKFADNLIYIETKNKGNIFARKFARDGNENLYLSFELDSISTDAKEIVAQREKRYGKIYIDGPFLDNVGVSNCIESLKTQMQFQKEQDTFSKEIKEHGPWGSEEGAKKEK
ncbi:hypothetical protein [Leptospira licerasiae]|uniref:hypothetical protein n=1 Tax=Leptospira licerasiae TaxID=447106 RepID=UPI001083EC7B|nr:hypothetical protein [Leptospira licerasiae]TGM85568.1 hypothetical protein EHR05_19450 [Leptospira licerasiae]